MGFFDDDFLLGMFDFNGDKKLDFGERLMRDAFLFDQFQKSEDKSESSGGDFFLLTATIMMFFLRDKECLTQAMMSLNSII